MYFSGKNQLTRREFSGFVLITYYICFTLPPVPRLALGLLRHQTVKLTPDGGMSFKQLRASLLLLPAIKDSFLHVHMKKLVIARQY